MWNFSVEPSKGEVGYELSPELQGKGIMQEALKAVLAYGFNTLELHVIEGIVQSENQKSIQILERNKFINKGLVKKKSADEEDIHSCVFELTNERYYSK